MFKKTSSKYFHLVFSVFVVLVFIFSCAQTKALATGWTSAYYGFKSENGATLIYVESLTASGDSSLITIKNSAGTVQKRILIDAGKEGGGVAAKLKSMGIKTINVAIITHNDSDHLNGLLKFEGSGIKITDLYYSFPHSRFNSENTKIPDALTFVKGLKNKVVTNKAIRVQDAQFNSGESANVNMETGNTEYLKICRGRLVKLSSTSATNGYDLTIIPPITREATGWNANDTSMMVVLETTRDKVIFGGDIQGTATYQIINYKNAGSVVLQTPNDAYSYYYGIEKYLFDKPSNHKYTVYKISHHGTGTNRTLTTTTGVKANETAFLIKMNPDALVANGASVAVNTEYYRTIFSKTKNAMYTQFANTKFQ